MASPSPPLLPGPQTTVKLLAEATGYRWSSQATQAVAARSISSMEGIGVCSIVQASTSRICAAESTGIMAVKVTGGKEKAPAEAGAFHPKRDPLTGSRS